LLAPLLPAGGGVLKVEGGQDLAGGIEDDGMVLVLRACRKITFTFVS
jgi:hypothetical protein